jgi:uncharacterized cupredoxin-like copper-binding protein
MAASFRLTLAVLALGLSNFAAHGHGEAKHDAGAKKKAISAEEYPWGREGDPRKASRTIRVDMADTMRFDPDEVKIRRGDTVKFVVRNSGKLMHEMVIGTPEELENHADLMKKHPGMEHGAPYMAHVPPGGEQEIVWTFDRPGTFLYGCLLPGHWEAGMKATIVVAAN